jgi:hypothetical protein
MPEPAKMTRAERDVPDPWQILDRLPAVTYETAAFLLGVGTRRIRQLVSAGSLERVGLGHARKVTSDSVRTYGGFVEFPEENGRNWQKTEISGNIRKSSLFPNQTHTRTIEVG